MQVNGQNPQQPDQDFGEIIIGSLTAGELLSLLQGGLEVLDRRHDDIRADIEAFILKVGGEKQA